mmetsp:Transcript_63161/g.173491  ORF Transcript_63161/g.173491 Transcript_63161/m.173491 type:complete len:203 (-) Transcript_63161:90-698(-)
MHTATNGGNLSEKLRSLGAPASLNLRGTRESIPDSLNFEYDSHCAPASGTGLEIFTRVPEARPSRLSKSQSPHVTAAPCFPLRSCSCMTPSFLLKTMTFPPCVPIASCECTRLHMQNEVATVIDGHSRSGWFPSLAASCSGIPTSHRYKPVPSCIKARQWPAQSQSHQLGGPAPRLCTRSLSPLRPYSDTTQLPSTADATAI